MQNIPKTLPSPPLGSSVSHSPGAQPWPLPAGSPTAFFLGRWLQTPCSTVCHLHGLELPSRHSVQLPLPRPRCGRLSSRIPGTRGSGLGGRGAPPAAPEASAPWGSMRVGSERPQWPSQCFGASLQSDATPGRLPATEPGPGAQGAAAFPSACFKTLLVFLVDARVETQLF